MTQKITGNSSHFQAANLTSESSELKTVSRKLHLQLLVKNYLFLIEAQGLIRKSPRVLLYLNGASLKQRPVVFQRSGHRLCSSDRVPFLVWHNTDAFFSDTGNSSKLTEGKKNTINSRSSRVMFTVFKTRRRHYCATQRH